MKKKQGGIVDRLGKNFSPNLDEAQRQAVDPKNTDMAYADVTVNPAKHRLSGGEQHTLVITTNIPELVIDAINSLAKK